MRNSRGGFCEGRGILELEDVRRVVVAGKLLFKRRIISDTGISETRYQIRRSDTQLTRCQPPFTSI